MHKKNPEPISRVPFYFCNPYGLLTFCTIALPLFFNVVCTLSTGMSSQTHLGTHNNRSILKANAKARLADVLLNKQINEKYDPHTQTCTLHNPHARSPSNICFYRKPSAFEVSFAVFIFSISGRSSFPLSIATRKEVNASNLLTSIYSVRYLLCIC